MTIDQSVHDHFLDLRFGMFIHYNMGTYHGAEWVEPDQDPNSFAPDDLNCAQWAAAASSAGMRYGVLTAKHHDGFCLWDSQYTDYSVAAAEALAGRDVVGEYCDSFRSAGLEPHLYFSIWDRMNGIPDGPTTDAGRRGELEGPITDAGMDLILGQLGELLTGYGPIGSLTFDGWGNCGADWEEEQARTIRAHIAALQPETLIGDHVQTVWHLDRGKPLEDIARVSDFMHFEEALGPRYVAPEGNTFTAVQGPTIQSEWFWKESFPSESLMPATDIFDSLDSLRSRSTNLLLNVAPNPHGLLDENVVARLAEVGSAWQR